MLSSFLKHDVGECVCMYTCEGALVMMYVLGVATGKASVGASNLMYEATSEISTFILCGS